MTGTVVAFCDWSSRDRIREACAAYGSEVIFVEVGSGESSTREPVDDVMWIDPGAAVAEVERQLRGRGIECAGVLCAVEQLTEVGTALAARLGLPHNPLDAVRLLRDKRAMKRQWARAGIVTARCVEGGTVAEATQAGLRYPVIVKPVFGAGSAGVRLVHDEVELIEQVRAILRFNRTTLMAEGHDRSGYLIEEYVPGTEYAIDVVIQDDVVLQAGILRKGDATGPTFPDRLYCTAPEIPAELRSRLIATALEAVRSCGMRVGGGHVEVRVDRDVPYVIEAAAKPGAGCGLYATLELGYGAAFFEALVGSILPRARASQVASVVASRSRPASEERAFLYNVGYHVTGRLTHRAVPAGFEQLFPQITEVVWRRSVGDYLPPEVASMSYLAWFRGLLPTEVPLVDGEATLQLAADRLEVSVG